MCKTQDKIQNTKKYLCRVLWQKRRMPAYPPIKPPKTNKPNKVFSDMRHLCCLALFLSRPKR